MEANFFFLILNSPLTHSPSTFISSYNTKKLGHLVFPVHILGIAKRKEEMRKTVLDIKETECHKSYG